jgi:hypothetical protein
VKLLDLDPRWISDGADGFGLGVAFDCPCCRAERVAILFEKPIDGGPAYAWPSCELVERDGSSFDDLTFTVAEWARGHWHGDVVQGEVR